MHARVLGTNSELTNSELTNSVLRFRTTNPTAGWSQVGRKVTLADLRPVLFTRERERLRGIYLIHREPSTRTGRRSILVHRFADSSLTWLVSKTWRMPFAALVGAVVVALAKMAVANFLLSDPWQHEG